MSYNLNGLSTYTDQMEFPLVHQTLFENRISKLVTQQAGVKSQVAINLISTDLQFQSQTCGNGSLYAGSGSVTLTQRYLTPGFIQAGEILCAPALNNYYLAYQLKPGSYQEEVPFEQQLSQYYVGLLQQQIEISLFNGNTASTTNNLSYFNGWVTNISSSLGGGLGTTGYVSASVHYSASSGSPVTSSNVVNIINGVYSAIPPALLQSPEKPVVMVGWDVYNTYIMALQALYPLSLFNFPANDGRITIPGTAVDVMAFVGLNYSSGNTNYSILAGQPSNFIQGNDLEDDAASFKFIYNPYSDNIQWKSKFTLAANVARPYEIVWGFNGQ